MLWVHSLLINLLENKIYEPSKRISIKLLLRRTLVHLQFYSTMKKVYAVYSGCQFEGGGVDRIYSKIEDAIRYAYQMFIDKNNEEKRV